MLPIKKELSFLDTYKISMPTQYGLITSMVDFYDALCCKNVKIEGNDLDSLIIPYLPFAGDYSGIDYNLVYPIKEHHFDWFLYNYLINKSETNEKISKVNIRLRMTNINIKGSMLYADNELNSALFLLNEDNKENGMSHSVTFDSYILWKYLKEYYPYIKCVAADGFHSYHVDRMNELLLDDDIDYVEILADAEPLFEQLNDNVDVSKIIIILNAECKYNCPYRRECRRMHSHLFMPRKNEHCFVSYLWGNYRPKSVGKCILPEKQHSYSNFYNNRVFINHPIYENPQIFSIDDLLAGYIQIPSQYGDPDGQCEGYFSRNAFKIFYKYGITSFAYLYVPFQLRWWDLYLECFSEKIYDIYNTDMDEFKDYPRLYDNLKHVSEAENKLIYMDRKLMLYNFSQNDKEKLERLELEDGKNWRTDDSFGHYIFEQLTFSREF